jgi:hypothetical protein
MTAHPLHVTAAIVLAAAVSLAGCSKGTPSSQAPSVTTTVDSSESPSTTPVTASPTASLTKGGGSAGPTFPTTAKAYAQALLTAWANKNAGRLDQLAVQSAVQQIKDNGYPNAQWTYIDCDASGETTACIFRNAHGDEVLVTMTNTQIGHPTAVTEALLTKTTYPTDAAGYVGAFIDAWQHGNLQRMTRLANSTVTDAVRSKTPPNGYTSSFDGSTVRIEQLPAGAGPSYVFTIVSGNLGKAHAIGAVSTP